MHNRDQGAFPMSYRIEISEEQVLLIIAHLKVQANLDHIVHNAAAWDTIEEERAVLLRMFEELPSYEGPRDTLHGFSL
jgi:hypothetical protein